MLLRAGRLPRHRPGRPGARYPLITAKWWGADRHLVHYWVSGGRELNFVAPVPEEAWTEESWSAEGNVTDLLDALCDFAEPVRKVAGATSTLMAAALYDRDPLQSWTYGRVTHALGDACHPMLPFMAQAAESGHRGRRHLEPGACAMPTRTRCRTPSRGTRRPQAAHVRDAGQLAQQQQLPPGRRPGRSASAATDEQSTTTTRGTSR